MSSRLRSAVHLQHRIDKVLWACIALVLLTSIASAVEISVRDAESIANSRPPELRPSREVGEFEIMMSRQRRVPYAPTLSAVMLLAFLISSQLMILRFMPNELVRWGCYSIVTLIGVVWTWYQITPWLFAGDCTVHAKVIGEPFYYVVIPYLFFICLVNSKAPWTPLKTVSILFGQVVVHLAWLWVWAFIQLLLGWYWI